MRKTIIGLSILFSSCAYAQSSTVCEMVTNVFDFGTRSAGIYIGADFSVDFRCSNNDVDFSVYPISSVVNVGKSELKQYTDYFRNSLFDETNPLIFHGVNGNFRDGWYYYPALFSVDWLGNGEYEGDNGYVSKEGFDVAGSYTARVNYMLSIQGVTKPFYIDYTLNIDPSCKDLDGGYKRIDFGAVPTGSETYSRDMELRISCTKEINEISVYPQLDNYNYEEGIAFRFMTSGSNARHITRANPYKYDPSVNYGAMSLELFNPDGGVVSKASTFNFSYGLIVEY